MECNFIEVGSYEALCVHSVKKIFPGLWMY